MEINKIWFADGFIYAQTDNEKVLRQSLKWYPRLAGATDKQREEYRFSTMGIHWEALDEDISFESFTYEDKEPENENRLAAFFSSHPEINVTQFANRAGIPRSVFASYLCGVKVPSKQRLKEIEKALHGMAEELSSAVL